MPRCCGKWQVTSSRSLYQFGIRSGVKEEFEYAAGETHLYLEEIFPALHQAVQEVAGETGLYYLRH